MTKFHDKHHRSLTVEPADKSRRQAVRSMLALPVLALGATSLIAGTLALPKDAAAYGWVKLKNKANPNGYNLSGRKRGWNFKAVHVQHGGKPIPDGKYYVTFWVKTASGKEEEYKERVSFKGGSMVNSISIKTSDAPAPPTGGAPDITSAGVSYPE